MPSRFTPTVADFLHTLPPDRRHEVERVRQVIKKNLPDGYVETIAKGMIVYEVPAAIYPDTYNGHPLWYVALASERHYLSLHLMSVYGSPELQQRLKDGFAAAGKKLEMRKACINFKRADDLALDTVGEIVAAVPLETWVNIAKAARSGQRRSSRFRLRSRTPRT